MIITAQFLFWHFYMFLYIFFPKVAHRMVGYFEEQAVISYTSYLKAIELGKIENIDAPKIAINYYGLNKDAKLSDIIVAVREDERGHSQANHEMADTLETENGR
jgi:ubiquinol oxidase